MEKKNLIVGINLGDYGSTGNIMLNSLEYANKNGPFDVLACIPYVTKNSNAVKTVSFSFQMTKLKRGYYRLLKHIYHPIFNDGNFYKENTKHLISIIENEAPKYQKVIIHMHNMHMCKLNVALFYKYLSKKNYIVLYTLHDCWSFTGGCYCYDFIGCSEWKRKCRNCVQKLKHTKQQLDKRTKLLNKITNLTLIPCSSWLNEELKKSRLQNIPSIINNGETSLKPFHGKSILKKELGIENKIILLSVSAYWNDWKGIKYIYELAAILPNNYIILLVGGHIEKQRNNIIHVDTIKDENLLAEYYSIADVFISTTQSDNCPLVIMEAQICGLPVVGFGHGGTPEEITEKSGIMVGKENDVNKMLNAIEFVIEKKPFNKNDIVSSGNRFKKYECAKRQLKIYEEIIKGKTR